MKQPDRRDDHIRAYRFGCKTKTSIAISFQLDSIIQNDLNVLRLERVSFFIRDGNTHFQPNTMVSHANSSIPIFCMYAHLILIADRGSSTMRININSYRDENIKIHTHTHAHRCNNFNCIFLKELNYTWHFIYRCRFFLIPSLNVFRSVSFYIHIRFV